MSKNYCKVDHKWCKFCKKLKSCMSCSYKDTAPLNVIRKCPKRLERETISLKKMLSDTNFYDIMTAMFESHPDEKKNIIGYFDVYKSIITYKKGIKTNGMLRCKKETWDNGYCVEIYGVFNHKVYAIDFLRWSEWVNMNVEKDTLESFTSEEICAAALYEMTFHGYTEEKVEKEYSYLEKSFEELKI